MTYDHWKTTEPPDSTPWQECAFCNRRDAESRMWLTEYGGWMCEDCADQADDGASEWDDDPCEAA